MKTIRLLLVLCAMALLCSCQAQLQKEYSVIKAHEEQFEVDQYSDALTAENYTGMKNAILSFVETGADYGVIRIYEYDGNVVSDLANAVYEVSHNDPLGAYAVDYMTYDYAHIVSYYELYIYTAFRIDTETIDDIIYCSNTSGVEAKLEQALTERKYSIAIRISNYQEFNPEEIMHRLFLQHPELGISEPIFTFTLYPNTGIQRILEMNATYSYDVLSMRTRETALAERADEIAEYLSIYTKDELRIKRLYRWFTDHVSYMGEDSRLFSSSYNALVNEYGSALGVSMAVQLLCNKLDIPCFTVEGSYQGAPWYWNIVYYDDLWHHMDVCQGIITEQDTFEPLYDSDMAAYEWDSAAYPVCTLPEQGPEGITATQDQTPEPNGTASEIDPDLDQLPTSELDTEADFNTP